MVRTFGIFTLILLAAVIHGCQSDAIEPSLACKPSSFYQAFDSIHLVYDSKGHLLGLSRFAASPAQNETEEYQYSNGQLFSGAATSVAAPTRAYHQWTLTYGSDGLPSKLREQWIGYYGEFITLFTHDSEGRLTQGITRVFNGSDPNGIFVGGFIYVYDDHDNVTTVKYIIADQNGLTKEVVARENLSFDHSPVFFRGSSDLTTRNIYVYRQIPNKNNTLTARVYYASYVETFSPPLNITFDPAYDKQGRIQSFLSNFPAEPQLGDILYTRLRYQCD